MNAHRIPAREFTLLLYNLIPCWYLCNRIQASIDKLTEQEKKGYLHAFLYGLGAFVAFTAAVFLPGGMLVGLAVGGELHLASGWYILNFWSISTRCTRWSCYKWDHWICKGLSIIAFDINFIEVNCSSFLLSITWMAPSTTPRIRKLDLRRKHASFDRMLAGVITLSFPQPASICWES